MTEPTSEIPTTPVAPPQPLADEPRRSRLTSAAAVVGIIAGVVFIVAVIFFSGFVLGAHSGGAHRGGHHGDRDAAIFHRGPPPMSPMGPRGQFQRPPGGPMAPPQAPGSPEAPTTAPARP